MASGSDKSTLSTMSGRQNATLTLQSEWGKLSRTVSNRSVSFLDFIALWEEIIKLVETGTKPTKYGIYDPIRCAHEDCFCDGCSALELYEENLKLKAILDKQLY